LNWKKKKKSIVKPESLAIELNKSKVPDKQKEAKATLRLNGLKIHLLEMMDNPRTQ
jgi:hypothetical protein